MAKNVIKLNEKQLRKIIKESVEEALKEDYLPGKGNKVGAIMKRDTQFDPNNAVKTSYVAPDDWHDYIDWEDCEDWLNLFLNQKGKQVNRMIELLRFLRNGGKWYANTYRELKNYLLNDFANFLKKDWGVDGEEFEKELDYSLRLSRINAGNANYLLKLALEYQASENGVTDILHEIMDLEDFCTLVKEMSNLPISYY